MKKLFLELSFAVLCTALLSACGGDSGSSADSLDESSSSSEMNGAESSDSEDLNSNGSEGNEGESSGSGGGESSGSGEGNSSGSSEEPESSSEGASSTSEEPESSSEGASSSSEEPESSSEEASSSSEEPESSSSEDVESSGSGEGSSASVPGGSSDSSVYDADKNTLTDLRDGQTYRTVKIGDQVWMAENLNYAYTGVPFDNGYYTSDSTSWCYDNDPANCAKYGRLYTWAAAMDSVGTWSTIGKGCGYGKTCSVASAGSATLVRGICPKGWHLPSHDEWEALIVAVDGSITEYTSSNTAGSKLKSATGWAWNNYDDISGNGTDAFGFSALPAGFRYYGGDYSNEGIGAYFWSSAELDSYNAYSMDLLYDYDYASLYYVDKYYGFSVRCLKD